MRTTFLFAPPAFGPRLGSPMPLRRRSLGFTPTGEPMPTVCTDLGTRMIVDQGGYSPIGCPTGPDCYDIIDAVTGQIVIAKAKGSMPWVDLCTQFGYTNPGGGTSTPPPSGDRLKACELPGHPGWYLLRYDSGPSAGGLVSSSPLSKAEVEKIAGTTPFSWTTDCPIKPDERIWILCNTSPTTMAFVDAITGEKRLEQEGQGQQHPLCPAPSQQTSAAPTSPCPEMTLEEFQAADKAEMAAWQASGGATVRGGCAIVVQADGRKEPMQSCYWPGMPGGGGGSAGSGGSAPSGENPVGTPGAPFNAQTGGNGMSSCDEKWKWICENIGGPNDPWKNYCPGRQGGATPTPAPAPTPAPTPTPAPAPKPVTAPAGEGPVPLSIDIQAFTPGGTGPIPTQPLMQPQPLLAPKSAQPAQPAKIAAEPATKLVSVVPKEPEAKPLDTGSAIGIGLVALTAIAAAIFGGRK
jgi:hypothetical protein